MRRFAKTTSTRAFALVLVVAALLAIGGCGGGDDSSEDTATTQTTTGTEAEKGSDNKQGGKEQDGGEGKQDGANAPQPEREPGITPQQRREATKADITLESTSFKSGTTLAAKYTCDGENTWPALNWKGLPPEAEELVVLVLSVQPVEQKLIFDWAVAGLDPSLTEIEEGELPDGAVVGENSFGKDAYDLCPPKGQAESYIFMLFAIPEALDPEPGFDAKELREEVLAEHGNVGLQNATYKR